MKVELGELTIDLTDEQVASLRAQLRVPAETGSDWVDAATVAKKLGCSRDFVYAHRMELGGKPIGDGPRPRWRFPASASQPAGMIDTAPPKSPARSKPRRRPRTSSGGPLLAIRGNAPGNVSGKVPVDD